MNGKKVERFEDLIAWQKARELTRKIYRLTEQENFAKDFGLKNQIQRASVSGMSNIAEGFERFRPKEFHQFLSIAKGSCAECVHNYMSPSTSDIYQKTYLPSLKLQRKNYQK